MKNQNAALKTQFLEAWNSKPDDFGSVKKLTISLLSIFSSTYSSESLFSIINQVHSKKQIDRGKFGSMHFTFQSTLYQPDIKNLATNMKQKTSNKK